MTITSTALTDQSVRTEIGDVHRLVLADDHPLYRRGLAWALTSSGRYEVVAEADNGGEALEAIRDQRPDLVVLDVRMPELDGLEVLHEMRATGDETPVVLLSAFDEAQIVLAGMIEGATTFLNKELARHQLVGAIDDVFTER